jgi:hypothetical protein
MSVPSEPGSRPTDGAADASPPKASIPNADPRGFTDWKHEPDEFDRWADEDGPCDEDDWFDNCGMTPSGQCMKAGSEECDFECPFGALGGQYRRQRA